MIDSAAATREEIGNPIYPPMASELRRRGVPLGTHRARQLTRAEYDNWDLIIGMDDRNIDELKQRAPDLVTEAKIHRMTEYSRNPLYDHVPDPYYSGADGFELVLDLLEDACAGLLESLQMNNL